MFNAIVAASNSIFSTKMTCLSCKSISCATSSASSAEPKNNTRNQKNGLPFTLKLFLIIKNGTQTLGKGRKISYLCTQTLKTILTMEQETQLDQLERLVSMIADDNELLNRANDFMQHLVNTKFNYRGKQDLSAELTEKDKKKEEKHQ